MNARKKIAIMSSQLEENYQKQFMEGFFEKAFSYDYDVCVFSSYRKYQETEARGVGETNIFSLVNYDLFDAVVVMPDTLQTPGLMAKIESELEHKFHGCVLYVDKESERYPYIMLDHYQPIKRLVNHLIEEHGYRDIAFLTGSQFNSHSQRRLSAFLDSMQEHGLKVQDDRIFYGNYWYDSGALIVESLMENREHLPEAVACANDYMAIGLAEALTKQGIRVPEDIAVIGYDSVEEGRMSPSPITSVPIPARPFGSHAAECVHALMQGETMPAFNHEEPIFHGGSCGCHSESMEPRVLLREQWETNVSARNYYSSFNHLMTDLVSQLTFAGLMDVTQTYSYQIREFDSFHICLNDFWLSQDIPLSHDIIKEGYTDNIIPVLHCGRSGEGADKLDYESRFPKEDMLPELKEDREYPAAFLFSPLFFEDMSFGYAVISYGNEPRAYDETYYMWLQSLMMGLECYRRIAALQQTNRLAEEKQITDSLTGMFNYRGFVRHAKPMIERSKLEQQYITVLAMDLSGVEKINAKYGRKEGDKAIHEFAQIIMQSADEGALCSRLGNDEFILAELTEEVNHKQIHAVRRRIDQLLEEHNRVRDKGYKLQMFSGSYTAKVQDLTQMEDLVNAAVSHKNGNKASEQRTMNNALSPEEQYSAEMVKKILDENLFTYHFQPIISARDGSIVAYEALMRAQVEAQISPLDIIKYATHLDRLYDVERATFFNILKLVEDKKGELKNRKVFINSIPGSQLAGEEKKSLGHQLQKHADTVVIELTEQTEADDQALAAMKEEFSSMGIETAVDDYGTGYSNIVNLLRYMPNYVKIDRMLLSGIQDNPQKQHFVKDIVAFAHENDFQVLAEGVETMEELETVIRLGVDLIQGYYTGRPNAQILPQIAEDIRAEILSYNQKEA